MMEKSELKNRDKTGRKGVEGRVVCWDERMKEKELSALEGKG